MISMRLAAASLLAVSATPAAAQIWIGQIVGNIAAEEAAARRERACMMGEPQPVAEVDETRAPSAQVIANYWAAARAGPANITRFFHDSPKNRWSAGGRTVGPERFTGIIDPLATTPGVTLEPSPAIFLRSGDGSLIRGQWRVIGADGGEAGRLDATFTRLIGVWRLRTLNVVRAGETVPPLAPFCHKPGDIEPYRIADAERERQRAERRARKQADRAARAAREAAR